MVSDNQKVAAGFIATCAAVASALIWYKRRGGGLGGTAPHPRPVTKVVYHGSEARFDKLERRPGVRQVLFTQFPVQSPAFFFAPTKKTASQYGPYVTTWKIQVKKPLFNAEKEEHLGVNLLDDQRFKDLRYALQPAIGRDEYGTYIDLGVQRRRVKDKLWPYEAVSSGGLVWDVLDCEKCVERLKERGYDGTTVHEYHDEPGYSWAIFNPEQATKIVK